MKWNAFTFIEEAISRTKKLLWPFSLGYWIKLTIVAILAGGGIGGGGSFGNSFGNIGGPSSSGEKGNITGNAISQFGDKFSWSLIGMLAGIVFILMLILSYIRSVFAFIFIDALVKKEYLVGKGWRENKVKGGSYFGFKIIAGIVFLAISSVILLPLALQVINLGFDNLFIKENLLSMIALIIITAVIFGIWFVIYGIIMGFVYDFCLSRMYKHNIRIKQAIGETYRKVMDNKIESFIYYLAKFVYSILSSIGLFLVILLVGILFAIPGVIIFVILFLIYKPVAISLLIAYILFYLFVVTVLLLPLSVFMKYFALIGYEKLFGEKIMPAIVNEK